ncbi:putative DNA replication licensing factor Mcm7 [Hyaloraphidium curvatum]|nr:putative DNA replication licensing factor Mcm7 [Hyaloraphidium curvatum]
MATAAAAFNVDYERETEIFRHFLEKFATQRQASQEDDFASPESRSARRRRPQKQQQVSVHKYKDQLAAVAEGRSDTITIDMDDIAAFDEVDDQLLEHIQENTARYLNLMQTAIDSLLPMNQGRITEESDPLEVLMAQRRQLQGMQEPNQNPIQRVVQFPPALTRRYSLQLRPMAKQRPVAVREVKAAQLGHLVTVKGIITRSSNVRPLLAVATYSCDKCGSEVFQEILKSQVTPLTVCPSEDCKRNGTKGALHMQTRASKFKRFQEIKLQELTDQVPVGHIPRTMTVYLYDSLTRKCNPGDIVEISGVFLPTPYTGGFAARAATLLTDTFLEGTYVYQMKKSYAQLVLTDEVRNRLIQLQNDPALYDNLARSISPNIYGHEDVKKALLLMLVGGVSKDTGDGMKIRGELNICLMGDPGVAKSQLLKYISRVAPRGVYTTGKGSSGVGLTAAVTKDPITNEMILEAGSLVLADNGIACIDEFDKMDENDRTAIHEVMEQQTISISKAGITTSLNARTSILAAANPAYGRYNTRLRATQNINLPAALLSRFDLLFLILDKPNQVDDHRLAEHVTHVHQYGKQPEVANSRLMDADLMRHYISYARTWRPSVPREVADYIVNSYVDMRNKEDNVYKDLQYTCARTLLSIIRMSTALARLRFSDIVEVGDVEEALRLIDVSKSSLLDDDRLDGGASDPSAAIYKLIREKAMRADGQLRSIRTAEAVEYIKRKGYSQTQYEAFISTYQDEMNVLQDNGTELTWITGASQLDDYVDE